MIAKIKVSNPTLKVDYYQNYELSFPVNENSKFAVKQLMKLTQENKKTLEIKIDYERKQRTLDQNALMWALLTEYATFLNGGRRAEITEEQLYIKALHKHGLAKFLLVEESIVETLKNQYRDTIVIDRGIKYKGKIWAEVKCIVGTSNEEYNTKTFANLIDGILDDMERDGVDTQNMRALEEEWRSYYANYNNDRL